MADDGEVELVHRAEPGAAIRQAGAYQRGDGLWVYRLINGADETVRSHAGPVQLDDGETLAGLETIGDSVAEIEADAEGAGEAVGDAASEVAGEE